MGILTIFEILSNFSQFLGIIGSVKVKWPDSLSWVGNYVRDLIFCNNLLKWKKAELGI
jgi:hypothetical protein